MSDFTISDSTIGPDATIDPDFAPDLDDSATGLEVAVIGMAGRFPGANSVDEFWRNLKEGVESLTEFTDEELLAIGESPELIAHPDYVRIGRVIENANHFDAALFGFSPHDAELVDPQQRLLLECGYEALERAGYDTERYAGLVGVFAGIKMTTYLYNIYSNPQIMRAIGDLSAQIANDKDYAATRLSYKLNLGGPSVTVQTACSTALVAVHLACQALLSGECEMALAGGVAVRTVQAGGYLYREGDILSPDGRCRTFDADARGTIFGNGVGMVVLKRLEDAVADGDHISAVIKGSAVNNDSARRMGYTTPGVDGQERVVRAAMTAAEVEPDSIDYIEAHGTGTPVGDPVEITALTRAFRASTERKAFCAVGSAKTNIGHLGAAAGIAGLIKTAMALEHQELPPSLLYERSNPEIDFESSPFYVNTELRPWKSNGSRRRAGVSAFGIGGTNAHAILEEAPLARASGPSRAWQLLLLSAKTETALDTLTGNLAEHLRQNPDVPLADVAFTLGVGRRELERRRMLICRDVQDAIAGLEDSAPRRVVDGVPKSEQPPVAFMFSGQGAQYIGMMADLYDGEAVYRHEVDRCVEVLRPILGLDLREVMVPRQGEEEESRRRLERTEFTQPALFVVEYALARLWMVWGIRPEVMIGHSIGEYVAACLAGVFSLEDALALVAARGRLMQAMPEGSMLAVSLPEEEILPLLGLQLSVAALNNPSRSVLAGPDDAVRALAKQLKGRKISARPLHTSHAFHSKMMEPALAPFLEEFARVQLHPPQIPYISNVTGTWVTEAEATDPSYWAKHMRGAVRFADGIGELLKEPQRLLIEVGPGQTLSTLARQHPSKGEDHVILASTRHPKKSDDDQQVLLAALGRAWLAGATVNWQGFLVDEDRRRVVLPSYPFERRRYFIEAGKDPLVFLGNPSEARSKDLPDWFHLPVFKPSVAPLPPESERNDHRWLLFTDRGPFGDALAEHLTSRGGTVTRVLSGKAFAVEGFAVEGFAAEGNVYTIDAARPEDYDALVTALGEGAGLPTRIVHAWSLATDKGKRASSALSQRLLEEAQEKGFFSLFYLARALGRQQVEEAIELAVLSRGIHQVTGREQLHPEKATVLGPVKVIPQEFPFLSCRSLDVEFEHELEGGGGAEELQRFLSSLVGEMESGDEEQVIAYRGGRRFVQGFEPIQLDRADEAALPLRQGGAYLITGGLGGIGLELAEYLARAVGARLILTGRSRLPAREQWQDWETTHGAEDSVSQKIRKVEALEHLGSEVLVVGADVGNEEQMRVAVAEARSRFGAIHGVIHTAGVAGGGMIQTRTAEDVKAVLWPKIEGTRALTAALTSPGESLDFLVLCSSTIAVLGSFGQVDYCAGNCFLDAFAHAHTVATGVPTVSIGWGAWREVGMAVNTTLPTIAAHRPQAVGDAQRETEVASIHPLVEQLVSATEKSRLYITKLGVARHWMLDEHRVVQTPTLPGTTYMEMLRAAWAHTTGNANVELRQVYFLAPLMVPEAEDREIHLSLEKVGDGFTFEVRSAPDGDGSVGQQHAQGEIGPARGPLTSYNLEEIRGRCDVEHRVIEEEMLTDPEGLVFWGKRWQCLEEVFVGRGEALARLVLPTEFQADVEEFLLHPALLDVATAMLSSLGEGHYLPLSYRRLSMARALPARFYSYIRGHESSGKNSETLTGDLVLLDEDGQALVEIEGFTMKRVGEAVDRLKESAAGVAAAASSAASVLVPPSSAPSSVLPSSASATDQQPGLFAQGGMSSKDGVEAFRRVLSRWPGQQVVVSPRDFRALLTQSAKARSKGALEDIEDLGVGRASHPRPSMQTEFIEPSNELEATLSKVWQEVLGIDQVGIHDNFYELGGDSVLGIQILARARQAGIELSSDQLFQHQTVAELALVVGEAEPQEGDGGESGVAGSSTQAPFSVPFSAPFSLAALEPEALELILEGRELEDLYPLSPLQSGLLLSLIENPHSGLYCEQVSFNIDQDLDLAMIRRAWQEVLVRHAILRTEFLWQDLEQPLQAVHKAAELEISAYDWRQRSPQEQQERLVVLGREEREKGFDLSNPPLMRLSLVHLGESSYRVLLSYSHLLMDGWTSPMIITEALRFYDALKRGEELVLEQPRPYRDYIAWLAGREAGQDREFWHDYLEGFTGAPGLAGVKKSTDAARGDRAEESELVLTAETSAALVGFVRQQRMTLNIATKAAWALLIGHLGGVDDVVFGIDLAGRPEDLAEVDGMVGVFVNMLPARVGLDGEERVVSWLAGISSKQALLTRHQYSLLSEVQAWSGVSHGQPLFETIYNFANYPSNWMGAGGKSVGFQYDSRNQFPLHLTVVPGDEVVLRILYDRHRVEAATIKGILKGLELLLVALPKAGEGTVTELRALLREEDRQQRVEAGRKASSMALKSLQRKARGKGEPLASKE